MAGVRFEFGIKPSLSEEALVVVPYQSHFETLLKHIPDGSGFVGWRIVTLERLARKLASQLFPEYAIASRTTLFAVAHSVAIESDYLSSFSGYRSPVFTEKLLEFFEAMQHAGILSGCDVDELNKKANIGRKTRAAAEEFKKFREKLKRLGLFTFEDVFSLSADVLRSGVVPEILAGKKLLVFHDFFEFNIPQQKFIKALAEKFDVTISYPLPYSHYTRFWRSPIDKLAKFFGVIINSSESASNPLVKALNGELETCYDDVYFLRLPDPQREARFTAQLAKLWALEMNLSPDEIAVITPDPAKYAPLLELEFGFVGLNIVSEEFSVSPLTFSSLLGRVFDVYATGFRREELAALFGHPIVKRAFPEISQLWVKNYTAKNKLISRDDWVQHDPKSPEAKTLKGIIETLSILGDEFDGSAMEEVLKLIEEVFRVKEILKQDESGELRAQWSKLLELVGELRRIYAGSKLSGYEIVEIIASLFAPEREERKLSGVRLTRVLQARGTLPRLAFFIGFHRDNFPLRHVYNPILDEDYTSFLPFVSDRVEVSRLALLETLLLAERSVLSIPESDGERELAICHPIDEIMRSLGYEPKIAEKKTLELWELIRRGYDEKKSPYPIRPLSEKLDAEDIERLRRDTITRGVTIRELETFFNCPIRFWFERVVGEPQPVEVALEPEPAALGSAFHEALRKFFVERFGKVFDAQHFGVGGKDLTFDNLREFVEAFGLRDERNFMRLYDSFAFSADELVQEAERLNELVLAEFEKLWEEEPALLIYETEVKEKVSIERLVKLIPMLIQYDDGIPRIPVGFEVGVELDFMVDGEELSVRGRIDRVDIARGSLDVSLVDYKTGYLPFRKGKVETVAGKEFQLQAYAEMLVRLGFRVDVGKYIARMLKWGDLEIQELPFSAVEELTGGRLARIEESLDKLFHSDFMPPDKKDYCKRCPYSNICHWKR